MILKYIINIVNLKQSLKIVNIYKMSRIVKLKKLNIRISFSSLLAHLHSVYQY